jgi:dephospho-CoA kinase
MPIEEKVSRADFVFNNEGPLDKAGQQIEKLWKRLLEEEQLHYHTF